MSETSEKVELSPHAREVIDSWVAKYPPDQKRSAVLAALREVQHENNGYLTVPLMDAARISPACCAAPTTLLNTSRKSTV